MKQLLHLIPISFCILSTPISAAETYQLDPNHTSVQWHVNHLGFSNPSGKWMAQGTLILDQEKPQNSKVDATIHIKNVLTGVPALDEHLTVAPFFNVKQFPTAKFVSDKVTIVDQTHAKVEGTVTINGISKPLTLDVTLNKIGENPINHKMTAGFSATGEVNRSDFGMKAYLPALGDKVDLIIEAEANKA